MKIHTKSGFVCEVDEDKANDWRFVKALADCDSGDESRVLKGMAFAVPFILGEDGERKLMDYVTNEKGLIGSDKIMKEFREVLSLIGEKQKKSSSSQA